jgi:hypothetical protein
VRGCACPGTLSTAAKDTLLRQIGADAANLRLRAARVYRTAKDKLKLFQSPITRHAAAPPAAPPPPATPPIK